jgi:hypothetical protein
MPTVTIVISDSPDHSDRPILTIHSDSPTVPTAAQTAAALAVDCIRNLIRKEDDDKDVH